MDTSSFSLPLELEDEKNVMTVTEFKVHISVPNLTKHNDIFTIYTPGYWENPEFIESLDEFIEQRKSY